MSRIGIGFRNTASAAAFPAASSPVACRRASCARVGSPSAAPDIVYLGHAQAEAAVPR